MHRTIIGNNPCRYTPDGNIGINNGTAHHGVGTDGDTVGYGNISYYGCAKTDKTLLPITGTLSSAVAPTTALPIILQLAPKRAC